MFWKANRLAQEIAGVTRRVPTPAPRGDIGADHVEGVVADAAGQLEIVKRGLGIETAPVPAVGGQAPDLTDVWLSIVQASRQLKLLLDRRYKPKDVFRRLEPAAGYAAGLLAASQGDDPAAPAVPKFKRGMMPRDVHGALLECVKAAQVIGRTRGVPILMLRQVPGTSSATIVPSDVYLVATSLLSDLSYLAWRAGSLPVPRTDLPAPTHIFPSHVLQVSRQLHAQLQIVSNRSHGRAADG